MNTREDDLREICSCMMAIAGVMRIFADRLETAALDIKYPDVPEGANVEVFDPTTASVAAPAVPVKKRRISAAGRARIAAAQKKRWAAKKAAAAKPVPVKLAPISAAKRKGRKTA